MLHKLSPQLKTTRVPRNHHNRDAIINHAGYNIWQSPDTPTYFAVIIFMPTFKKDDRKSNQLLSFHILSFPESLNHILPQYIQAKTDLNHKRRTEGPQTRYLSFANRCKNLKRETLIYITISLTLRMHLTWTKKKLGTNF